MKNFFPLFLLFVFSTGYSQNCIETEKLPGSGLFSANFGFTVDVEGDRIVVGAPNTNKGTVHIYDLIGGSWIETEIQGTGTANGDKFGFAIDLDGDRLAVGTPFGDGNDGAIYVYDWDGTTWIESAILTAGDGAPSDRLGWSVGLSGDRIIGGAVFDQDNGQFSGSAYVFEFDGSSWSETAKLVPSNGIPAGNFGLNCAIDGDRIVVDGRYNGTIGGLYIFNYDGSAWIESLITASDINGNDNLGFSLKLVGDVIVAGSPGDDDNGSASGSVYIFNWDGTNWIETKITPSIGNSLDNFGRGVAYDGIKIMVGAPYQDQNGNQAGAAYVYEWNGSSWVEEILFPSDADAGDEFGIDVGISGNRIIVGAHENDDLSSDSGSVYIFECCLITTTYFADTDGDGFGDNGNSIDACPQPIGYVEDNTDCDDADANNFPGNPEVCDGFDNNCNVNIDEGLTSIYYLDNDQDGFGNNNNPMEFCNPPGNYVLDNTDCDDSNELVFPGNNEKCDGVDNNCAEGIDEDCGPCDGTNLVISTLSQDTSRAVVNIQSDAVIGSVDDIRFSAGSSIDLNADFEVSLGTSFEADIQDCENN